MTAPTLRPYQEALANRVRQSYATGHRAPLVVLPTGGGKTTIFSHVATNAAARGNLPLTIAHRAELIKQIAGTLARFGTGHQIVAPGPVIRQCQVEQFRQYGRTFVQPQAMPRVASVQTLVKRLDNQPAPDLIIVDEAHHAVEDTSWGRVIDHYPKAKLLLVTATPIRLDGRGLGVGCGGYADDLIIGPSMATLIHDRYLSPYRVFAPPSQIDLSGVRTRAGDYAKDQLAAAMDKPKITGSAVEHYQKITPGKRAIVFCVSVGHAEHVASEFRAAGVASASLDGSLDALERDRRIKDFEAGRLLVLTSCDIVSEGFDLPAIEVAILLRPTESLSLYLQQVGRALRLFPGKEYAVILDHVGAVLKHGLPDEDREWTLDGLPPRKRAANDNAPDVKVTTCPKCFAVHLPGPACPVCNHVYPVRERKLEEKEGELAEITPEQMDAMRRERRMMQGKAETIADLMAQGISKPRAMKILAARQKKQAMLDHVLQLAEAEKIATGRGTYAAWGVTLSEIRRMKPKELQGLIDRFSFKEAV